MVLAIALLSLLALAFFLAVALVSFFNSLDFSLVFLLDFLVAGFALLSLDVLSFFAST